MTLFKDVLTWAQGRPWWQQQALSKLAAGETISDGACQTIAKSLLGEPPEQPDDGWLGELKQPIDSANEQVKLIALRGVENVNRLAAGQEITFSPDGVTVVYGHNGSGKSGYARLIQSMVRTRHQSKILPDVFATNPGKRAGTLEFTAGGTSSTVDLGSPPPLALSQATFYNERCGDDYLTSESEVSYRPSTLTLLDDLSQVCLKVREYLTELLSENTYAAQALPTVSSGTEAATFLKALDHSTTDEEIETSCRAIHGDREQLARLKTDEVKLRAADPKKEMVRLTGLAKSMECVADHLVSLGVTLGETRTTSLKAARTEALELRAAADIASSKNFDAEPISGVGSITWRSLWQAAEAFSREEAYRDHEYPHTEGDAVCVLCQQTLSGVASDRLSRFHTFLTDDTAEKATRAELARNAIETAISSTEIIPTSIALHLQTIDSNDESMKTRIDSLLHDFDDRKQYLSNALSTTTETTTPATAESVLTLRAAAADARRVANEIGPETTEASLQDLMRRQQEIAGRLALAEGKEIVMAERDRLTERQTIETARSQSSTKGITDKIGELTRRHVTVTVQDRFTRESDRLLVERVALKDTRAKYGTLLHKPAFIEITTDAALPEVLSEGEQTALGLAGFLTESHFDTSKSALIFDDPVTSLDHVRRDRVAERITEYALDRQVIVFTHDITLTAELRRACEVKGVDFTERSIERGPKKSPGICRDRHPWSASDSAGRINELRERLAEIKRSTDNWETEKYENEVKAWAGGLSETWERIVSQEIAGQLVKPGTLEVQVRMMKVVREITASDEAEFQASYSRCSKWAPRHDNHAELNYVAPEIEDLQEEIEIVDRWFKRIKKYKNT